MYSRSRPESLDSPGNSISSDKMRSPRMVCTALSRVSRRWADLGKTPTMPAIKMKPLTRRAFFQFAVKDDQVYIIEANPRASRTVPFIAKAYGEPYVNHATKVMMGEAKLKDLPHNPELDGYAVKIPVFSYEKFPEVNKELGPEMKSTGEGIRFIPDLRDSFFRKVYSERNLYLSK